jgi:hypothetical protein
MSKANQERGGPETVDLTRYTRCGGTFLAVPLDDAERQRVYLAAQDLMAQRAAARALYADGEAFNAYCIELFRRPQFSALTLSRELVASIINALGEPPVPDAGDEAEFSAYLNRAAAHVATAQNRRVLASQLRRMLPVLLGQNDLKAAIAVDYSSFRTSLGTEISPFLAQITLNGLAAYYDEQEETPAVDGLH